MEATVSMTRDSAQAGGRTRFSCTAAEWNWLLEVGKTFGWQPRGVNYVPAYGKGVPDATIRHNYEPGDAEDYKQLDTEDAIAWAAALSDARRSPNLPSMSGSYSGTAKASTHIQSTAKVSAHDLAILDEFIEYAFGGAFSFARSADSSLLDTKTAPK